MPLSGYGGVDTGAYEQEAADLGYRYNTDRATNAYGRFLSQQRGERNLGGMSRTFSRSLPNYKAGFGRRGLSGGGIRSGSMNRAMGNFLGDYARDYGQAQQDMTQEAQQYDMSSAQMDAYYNNSLAALEQRKQTDIANAALAIEALRPHLGGL
jgi:hypothetical protein